MTEETCGTKQEGSNNEKKLANRSINNGSGKTPTRPAANIPRQIGEGMDERQLSHGGGGFYTDPLPFPSRVQG